MKKPPMRECLQLIKPYQPGKPIEEVERELGLTGVIKMASNENPLGPSPKAVQALRGRLESLHYYPDGSGYYLKSALAEKLKVKPEQLIFGNGSDEILSFLTLVYMDAEDEAIMATPSFSEYDFAVRLMGADPVKIPLAGPGFDYDLDAILGAVNAKTRLVFICSPNNPTGSVVSKEALDRLVRELPDDVILVLDQAYCEYMDNPAETSGYDYLEAGLPVIMLRTFSKIYGLAGLRIGYGIGPEEIIADLNRVREPFNVNSMAQAAAIAAIEDDEHLERSRALVLKGRQQLGEGFAALGLKAVPDQANFCFVDTGKDSRKVFEAMLRKGVIVRTGDIFGHPTFIRVTYGTEEQNSRFLKALEEVLAAL